MKRILAALALLPASPALAGGSIQSSIIPLPATIAAGASATSGCIALAAPPFDVIFSMSAKGTLTVQRYGDKACQWPARTPIAVTLADTGACLSGPAQCGDAASPDGIPHMALRVTIKNTDTVAGHVYGGGALLVQDPPAPIPDSEAAEPGQQR